MDSTRDPNIDPYDHFSRHAEAFFTVINSPVYKDPFEAKDFILIADSVIEAMYSPTPESAQLNFCLASAIACAFIIVFAGEWKFDEKQGRWIVQSESPNGELFDLNVFNKFEKRVENGAEDSIGFFFEMNRKMWLEGSENTL